jgi:selenocysteine lyase/cysteine desulfurase
LYLNIGLKQIPRLLITFTIAIAGPLLYFCFQDAVFISPHKFVGGVGTPGLLIAKRKLFNNPVPDKCGGGTVTWVTQQGHEYIRDIEEREEGGTPAIVEAIRAGLAFQVGD